jgi:hypothetical protein
MTDPFFRAVPPDQPRRAPYESPRWDRAPDLDLPGTLAVDAWVSSGDRAGLWIESLSVYRTGFHVNVVLYRNPYFGPVPARSAGGPRFPRLGVRFGDGREAGRGALWDRRTIPKGADGYPSEIFIGYGGSHGRMFSTRTSYWVHPLPPDGPMDLFVSSEADGVRESVVTLDGASVRAASEQSRTIWPDSGSGST